MGNARAGKFLAGGAKAVNSRRAAERYQPRLDIRGGASATVTADNNVVYYVLSEAVFQALVAERPVIAVRLLANVARELSARLRQANRMISELER